MDDDFGVVELGGVTHPRQRLLANHLRLDPLHVLVVALAGVEYEYVVEDLFASVALSTTEDDEELAEVGGRVAVARSRGGALDLESGLTLSSMVQKSSELDSLASSSDWAWPCEAGRLAMVWLGLGKVDWLPSVKE